MRTRQPQSAAMASRGTTPEHMHYHNRFMADSVSGDSSDSGSVDSASTPPARVTMAFKTFSDDGVHYFKTRAQLKAWRGKQERLAEAAEKAKYNRPDNPLLRLVDRAGVCEECETGVAAVTCVRSPRASMCEWRARVRGGCWLVPGSPWVSKPHVCPVPPAYRAGTASIATSCTASAATGCATSCWTPGTTSSTSTR